MRTNQKGSAVIIVMVTLLIVGVVGFIGWRVYDKNTAKKNTVTASSTAKVVATTTSPSGVNTTASLKEFCSEVEKACFKYPSSWTLKTVSKYSNDPNKLATESIDITSPNKTVVTWTAPLDGIGGGCDLDKTNEIFIDTVKTNPQDAKLYIVQTHVGPDVNNKITIGTYKPEATGKTPVVGTTGDCIFFNIFRKSVTGQAPAIMFHTTSYNQKDEAETFKIFESIYYK